MQQTPSTTSPMAGSAAGNGGAACMQNNTHQAPLLLPYILLCVTP
jgi:hypothetical protein